MDLLEYYRTNQKGWPELDAILTDTPMVWCCGSPMLGLAVVQAQCASVGRVAWRRVQNSLLVQDYPPPLSESGGDQACQDLYWQTGMMLGVVTTEFEGLELCLKTRPRLLVTTEELEDGDGISLIKAVKSEIPDLRTLLLLQGLDQMRCHQAKDCLSDGIMVESLIARGLILQALQTILDGGIYLDPEVQSFLQDRASCRKSLLTQRELEVMELVVRGLDQVSIGRSLVISPNTVKFHLKQVFGKLGVSSRTQAAVAVLEMGLVSPSASPVE
jgi:DNA-binding NarL/FixJ family response regulator